MRATIICSFLIILGLPKIVWSAVTINEVAWMGSTVSANHEWIELYNDSGSTVSLDGWTLSDGMNLEINIEGTLSANDYGVLERTSEESAPGSAIFIYTGALVNTGATLTLRDTIGSIVDQVAGGENWLAIGGDNATKETAQYTAAGWVTDVATPGAMNRSGRAEDVSSNNQSSTTTVSSDSGSKSNEVRAKRQSGETVRLRIPDTVLKLSIDSQSVAYVNQTINFEVKASGVGETIIDSLKYTWNFGDTYTNEGKKVSHAYQYPGTYVITVRAAYGRHDQVERHEITILPVTFSITRAANGDVQIHNDAPYDVDISGYTVTGISSVTFPRHSILLPKATVTIAKERLGSLTSESLITFKDTTRTTVTHSHKDNYAALTVLKETAPVAVRFMPTPVSVVPEAAKSNVADKLPTTTIVSQSMGKGGDNISATLPPTKIDTTVSGESSRLIYLVWAGLILLAFVGIVWRPKREPLS